MAGGIKLTQEMIDNLVSKLQYYKYQVAYGEQVLGPLNSPPGIEPETETKETVLYETGVDPLAEILSKNNARITLEVNDVETALQLKSTYKKGDNILSSEFSKPLTFVPLTDDETAKTLTFPNAFLVPGMSFNPVEGDDPNYVSMEFIAKPDVASGALYTFE
jgi:hypothetical protein